MPPRTLGSDRANQNLSEHARLEAQLVAPSANAGVDPQARTPVALLEGTILVVDDDADLRAYVTRCLRAMGYAPNDVVEAVDGEAAMIRVQHGGIALVISDIVMPGMDGLALCRALRADDRFRHLPLLLITGEYQRNDLSSVCSAHTAVLLKPFNAHKLRAALDELLRPASPA